jgi:hypothetical protein
LIVRKKPYSNQLELFGAIPPLSGDDISRVTRGKLGGAFEAVGTGTKSRLELVDFLPTGRAGLIELEPDSPRFKIQIKPEELDNGGDWVAGGLQPGDVFLGNSEGGSLIKSPKRATGGQSLYFVIAPSGPSSKRPNGEILRLGHLDVVRIEVNQERLGTIQSFVPELQVDYEALQVDVVSPLSVPPSDVTLGRLRVPPRGDILLAITLPSNKDLPLEVFPIPFHGSGQVRIPPAGLGVTRFLRLTFDGQGSQRILIHWPFEPDRDRILDFILAEAEEVKTPAVLDPPIGLLIAPGPILSPLFHPVVSIDVKTDETGTASLPRVGLIAPAGFSVSLRGEFPGEDGKPVWLEERDLVNAGSIAEQFKDVFSRGCRTLEVSFGSLGSISLSASGPFESAVARRAEARRLEAEKARATALLEQNRREVEERVHRADERRAKQEKTCEEIRKSLRERHGRIPRHVSGAFVRELLAVPEGTPADEIHWLRYLVRKVRKQLRDELGTEYKEEAV